MKSNTAWKSRTDRQVIILEAFDAEFAVYRIREGNKLTKLSIVPIGEFLKNFQEVENGR